MLEQNKFDRNYKNLKIDDEINREINTIKLVKVSRIKASQRIYGYSKRWKVMAFAMNSCAILFLIVSLAYKSSSQDGVALIISGFYSVYTIITQYYIETQNYNERAVHLHYHQLQLEHFILQLKELLIGTDSYGDNDKIERYSNIMSEYRMTLGGYEDYEGIDKKRAKIGSDNIEAYKKVKDFGKDNIFINMQIIVIILFVIVYTSSLLPLPIWYKIFWF